MRFAARASVVLRGAATFRLLPSTNARIPIVLIVSLSPAIDVLQQQRAEGTLWWSLGVDNLLLSSLFAAMLYLQGNFEFGISRIIKSLEPYEKKLGTDTWFYAKRCFLALAEQVCSMPVLC